MGILNRIYSDYLLPDRMKEYERLLNTALQAGYEHITLTNYFRKVVQGNIDPNKKYFIHRHDIDTDPATARRFFEAERKAGVRSSYYFRLKTFDAKLAREIHATGSEVGYHYEELASYCKQHKIRSAGEAKKHFKEIGDTFRKNLTQMEKEAGFKFTSICSHGDFANKILGLSNYAFVNAELMADCGIELETYNDQLLKSYTTILTDQPYPAFYKPENPLESIAKNYKVIYLLTHPRHWHCSRLSNTRENFTRLIEGLQY